MDREIIFVTGYFGAPIVERARKLAAEKGYGLISLDEEIEKKDGRTIRRLCMMMGEHEYRNKEYELLKQIVEGTESFVVACGDGVLHDDMSKELMRRYAVLIVGTELSMDALWENAREDKTTYHAFLHFGSEEAQKERFAQLHQRQRRLFEGFQTTYPRMEEERI